jgi:hypothetical protein
VFLACFYVLISKINFKKQKYIILMYFQIKNILKINHNHNVQQTLNLQYFLYFYDFILVFVTNTCIWKKKIQSCVFRSRGEWKEEEEKKHRLSSTMKGVLTHIAPPWWGARRSECLPWMWCLTTKRWCTHLSKYMGTSYIHK